MPVGYYTILIVKKDSDYWNVIQTREHEFLYVYERAQ